MSQKCFSDGVRSSDIVKAAEVLYRNFVRENVFSPIDKMAYATSAQSLLVAVYEVMRGVRSPEDRKLLDGVVRAIEHDVSDPSCLERALIMAKRLATRAVAYRERAEKEEEEKEAAGE